MKTMSIPALVFFLMLNGCGKTEVSPCVKGVTVASVGNCYLIIQVLNAPIGKKYTYIPPNGSSGQQQTFSNAVSTSLTINGNLLDTIYFRYKLVPYGTPSNCQASPGIIPPSIPRIDVLFYSKLNCPQ